MNFTGGNCVNAHPFFVRNAINRPEGCGFAGIERESVFSETFAECLCIQAAVKADPLLVHEIERRPVFPGEGGNGEACKRQGPVGRAADIVRENGIQGTGLLCKMFRT